MMFDALKRFKSPMYISLIAWREMFLMGDGLKTNGGLGWEGLGFERWVWLEDDEEDDEDDEDEGRRVEGSGARRDGTLSRAREWIRLAALAASGSVVRSGLLRSETERDDDLLGRDLEVSSGGRGRSEELGFCCFDGRWPVGFESSV